MKNNYNGNILLRKTFVNFIVRIIAWTLIVPLSFFFVIMVIVNLDFQWLYNISPDIYHFCIQSFEFMFDSMAFFFLVAGIWAFGFFYLVYNLNKKVFSYLSEVSLAVDEMFDKNVEYITLPSELSFIEDKMNRLKYTSLKNERLAKENEQKKDDLIVYLAHDIKTPLTSMIGYLSLLDEVRDMPEKQREKYISVALGKSYRLEELINELFDVARFNSERIILEKERLDLILMLEQIIDDFYPTLKELDKNITLDVLGDKKVFLEADPDKLARVFNNVIKNAINYSSDNSNIRIVVLNEKKKVAISIINNGKKIPEDKLKMIFEKFYRLDSSRTSKTGGSGLGLAIAKEIVELHDGSIKATSSDIETKFIITLPLKEN